MVVMDSSKHCHIEYIINISVIVSKNVKTSVDSQA